MSGKSAGQALSRRSQVETLDLRGATPTTIARALGADPRTVRRDLQALTAQRERGTDLDRERLRLLDAARLVEREAWLLFDALPPADANGRLGALAKVIAGQLQAAKLVGALTALDLRDRIAALEATLAARAGEAA